MARNTSKTPTDRQPAIAYVRVSTAGQVEDGVSLDAQRSKIAAWCDVMGYELVHTFADEGISGHSMKNRPALNQALDAVCACGGVLVVYSLSRLARNTRERGVTIIGTKPYAKRCHCLEWQDTDRRWAARF